MRGGHYNNLATIDWDNFYSKPLPGQTDDDWDVQRDHVTLLATVLEHIAAGGRVYFSTNSRRFKLRENDIPATSIHEVSRQTVPEDFRNRRIHRCWVIEK